MGMKIVFWVIGQVGSYEEEARTNVPEAWLCLPLFLILLFSSVYIA